ncbi:MAG: sucB [Chlamydiia bacterium]|nr:sucB [Chlamydiia bacterium]
MKLEMKIPSMGESITQVTIGKLLQKSGAEVQADQEVIEIETDKLNQVLYAPASGTLTFLVKPGDVVKVGDVIATLEEHPVEKKNKEETPSKIIKMEERQEKKVERQQEMVHETSSRLQKEAWVSALDGALQEEKVVRSSGRSETRRKLSNIRKVIAQRLVEVKQETAMLTTFNEIDMSAILGLREKYKEQFQIKFGVKLGFMSFFVKAVTDALQSYPTVNSYLDKDELVLRNYLDIGVAVSTERGLVVPVLRGTDTLSYADIEKKIEDVALRARTGSLSLDELSGGGFTITNGGVFGSLLSTPILNPSQCAILGMHTIIKRAVVVDDQIVIRPMMYLALSYDHRIIDGKEAVSFLVHIKNHLEKPELLVLGL